MKYVPQFLNHHLAFQKCNETLFLNTQNTAWIVLNTNKEDTQRF